MQKDFNYSNIQTLGTRRYLAMQCILIFGDELMFGQPMVVRTNLYSS